MISNTKEVDFKEVEKALNTPGFKIEYDENETDIRKIKNNIFGKLRDKKK